MGNPSLSTKGVVHKSLDVLHRPAFLSSQRETQDCFSQILQECDFFRPTYESNRFKKTCVTPCWTNVYGGDDQHPLYEPITGALKKLLTAVEEETGRKYNVALVRLYYDGKDNIAWHTDARAFLGSPTSVASLSLGAPRVFEMRMPEKLWPTVDGSSCEGNGLVDTARLSDAHVQPAPATAHVTSPAEVSYLLKDGDLLVMNGKTQDYWHHRVPTESARNYPRRLAERGDTMAPPTNTGPKPRLNINFRYILPGKLSLSGTDTYYQYCRAGVTALPDDQAAETARAKCQGGTRFDAERVCGLVYGTSGRQAKLSFPVVTTTSCKAILSSTRPSGLSELSRKAPKQSSIRSAFQRQQSTVTLHKIQHRVHSSQAKKKGARQSTLFEATNKKAKTSSGNVGE